MPQQTAWHRDHVSSITLLDAEILSYASVRQFKDKFGGLKKLRAHEWQEVGREIRKRKDQEGKASDVYIVGQRQEPGRIKRALQHSRTKRDLSTTGIGEQLFQTFPSSGSYYGIRRLERGSMQTSTG